MTRIGIVGLGFMAATHLKAYRQVAGAEVAALCNPSGRNLDGDFSKVTGNVGSGEPVKLDMARVRACRDYAELLSDPAIDLIDICAPTHAHPELAMAALRAGKHVICEKPMARTSTLAQEVVRAAADSKRFLMPAMVMRFWPEWVWIKRAMDAQVYGRTLSARFCRLAEPPGWSQKTFFNGELSGGALLDFHIHDTDFVQFCFGRPAAVYSTGYSKQSGAIDHVVTQYDVASGAIVHAEGGWTMSRGFGFSMTCRVNFEGATVDYDLARGAEALKLFEDGKPAQTITCEKTDGYIEELRHIVEAVACNRPPSVVTAEDGATAVEICEAEEQSALTGKAVSLS
jgi:predicted dehydrogenase